MCPHVAVVGDGLASAGSAEQSQALTDPRAAKFKAQDMVDLRFVDEMRKSGFVDKLYGRSK